jgi:micrococcal nuclease
MGLNARVGRHGLFGGLRCQGAWRLLCLAAVCWLMTGAAFARSPPALTEVEGVIVRVVDGDTLRFQPSRHGAPELAVRLIGVDAPESCQPWGRQALQALRRAVEGRAGTLRLQGVDVYRRTLAVLWVEGRDINRWLVEAGHAWAWRDRPGVGLYLDAEPGAIAGQRGLHASGDAQPPWTFRSEHGRCRR